MKMTLLNTCLLLSLAAPLMAQDVTIDSWVYVDESSGNWNAGAEDVINGDPACDYCGIDLEVVVTVKEDGVQIAQKGGGGINDYGSVEYDSPTIVNLGSNYDAIGEHRWSDDLYSYDYFTESSVTVPGVPNIWLSGVNASSPPFAQWGYSTSPNGFQSLYSSTVVIGNQAAISYSKENPTFTFDQSQYPGLTDEPVTTPVTFQGYLAGHFFGGPTTSVTVWLGKTVTDYTNQSIPESTEITGGIPTVLSTTHTAAENFDLYTYPPFLLFTSLPEYVVHMNAAKATIDTHNNICTPTGPAECDIFLIGEVNRWPFPPYPAINNDPMHPVPITIWPDHTDSTNLWALEADYYGLWLQEGTGFAVCNTLFQIRAYSGGTPDLPPMGCIGLTLP